MLLRSDFSNDPEKIQRYASIIYKENKRLENQVERVLNVAKLDTKPLVLKKEAIQLDSLLNEIKENFMFNQLEKEGNIDLNLIAEKHVIFADQIHFTNVIYNLIDNAIKYCDKAPQILISTKTIDNQLQLSFSDNGIGIKKEDLKLIFDKFYRVPTGNLHNVKGFGLGLFYVKLIIDAHNGKIVCESSKISGTTFTITIPY
jgi:two-component system phosphate regulon sensor histidine kinase PhoR